MTDWTPREEVTMRHGLILPPTLPFGTYEIHVGLDNPATGMRLPLQNGSDKILLGIIIATSENDKN